jgi:hypothetical protein
VLPDHIGAGACCGCSAEKRNMFKCIGSPEAAELTQFDAGIAEDGESVTDISEDASCDGLSHCHSYIKWIDARIVKMSRSAGRPFDVANWQRDVDRQHHVADTVVNSKHSKGDHDRGEFVSLCGSIT